MTTGPDPFATPLELRDPARRLRGRLTAPVTLWTAGDGDHRAGLTVSSILVAEGEPALVLGLIGPLSELWEAVARTGALVVHVLAEGDRRLAERFAGVLPSPGGSFQGLSLEQSAWGPVLPEVGTRAFCRLVQAEDLGYHRLVRGAIERVDLGGDKAPLAYLQGRFRRLAPRR
jgi:3-hydroxy-9,10-secoandrosta-1,3,5(10)-triene-9,17-dione monooxygenase reductase component